MYGIIDLITQPQQLLYLWHLQ